MGTEVKAEAQEQQGAVTKPPCPKLGAEKGLSPLSREDGGWVEGWRVHPQALGCSLEKVTAGNQNLQDHQSMGLDSDQTSGAKKPALRNP